MIYCNNNYDAATQHAYWEEIFDFLGVDGFNHTMLIWTPLGSRLVMQFYSDEEHKEVE